MLFIRYYLHIDLLQEILHQKSIRHQIHSTQVRHLYFKKYKFAIPLLKITWSTPFFH